MGTCISVYHVCLGTEEAGRGPLIPWSWSNMIVSYHVGAGNEPCCSQVQPVGVFLFWFGFGFFFLGGGEVGFWFLVCQYHFGLKALSGCPEGPEEKEP